MKKDYQVYKRHHNDKFIGWEVGEAKRDKNDNIVSVKEIALFYNPNAKEHAERFVDDLEFQMMPLSQQVTNLALAQEMKALGG